MRAAIATALVLALAAPVHAQPRPADRAKAASHFKQGQLYFANGDFDRAIAEYQQAYDLSKEPLLLFNMALCEDRSQRPENALALFKQYLDATPDGPVADEARENVTRLTPIVEGRADKAKQVADAEAARLAEAERKATAERNAAAVRETAAREKRRKDQEASLASQESHGRMEKLGGLALGGVGVVGLAVAAYFGQSAASDADAINAHTMDAWTDELLARDEHGRAANKKAILFSIAGGVCVLGGAGLYMLGHHTQGSAEEQRLELRAGPTSGGAQASLRIRF